jgi:hypothetical protein
MNLGIRRLSSAAILSVLCACTVGASLAWACAPSSWGWSAPATPESTPGAGSGAPSGSPGSQSAPSATLAPAEATPAEPPQSQSRQPTQSPARTPARAPSRGPSSAPQSRGFAPQGTPGTQARGDQGSGAVAGTPSRSADAGSAGVTRSGEAKKAKKSKKRAVASDRSSVAPQAAIDADAWSGAGGLSLMPSASDPAGPASSAGGQLGLGIALAGLGLVGLFGALALAGARRRRAPARRSVGS